MGEIEIRQNYIEEIVALEQQISDDSKAVIALERGRADAAELRAASAEADRDLLLSRIDAFRDAGAEPEPWQSARSALYSAADQVRKELGE